MEVLKRVRWKGIWLGGLETDEVDSDLAYVFRGGGMAKVTWMVVGIEAASSLAIMQQQCSSETDEGKEPERESERERERE